jgi:thioredoxin 1
MSAENVIEINDLNFEVEVLGSAVPFLLDFTTAWCPPCRALAPIVERLARDHAGEVRVGKIDIDESPSTAARLRIQGAPTVVAFKGGKEVGRKLGVTNKETLFALLGG